MVHTKQRPRLPWGKRSDDTIRDIGSPVLLNTTLHQEWLDRLPKVNEYQSQQRSASAPVPEAQPRPGRLDPKLMKELPSISLDDQMEQDYQQRLRSASEQRPASAANTRSPDLHHEVESEPRDPRLRPISEVPTASSIYTRSPDLPYGFDPDSQVAPLFSGKSNPSSAPISPPQSSHATNRGSQDGEFEKSESSFTLKPGFMDREKQAGVTSLGITTNFHSSDHSRLLWQGASGQTTQLTPITATPITMSQAGSVSPLEDQSEVNYFPYRPSDETPTSQAREPAPAQLSAGQPETPQTSNGDQRPNGQSPDSRTSPEYRQPQVSRFSWTTYATESDLPKNGEISTPKTNYSFGSWATPSPPRNHHRGQSSGTSIPVPTSSNSRPQAASATAGGRSKIMSKRESYGQVTTYPGVRYQMPLTRSPNTTPIDASPQSNLDQRSKRLSPIMARGHPMSSLPRAKAPSNEIFNPKQRADVVIKRKPAPSSATAETQPLSPGLSPTAPGDTDKSLPNTPATLSSIDHITLLQSELSTLSLRRHNLTKRINRLNETFAPQTLLNPMSFDLQKRRELRTDIANLEAELAEVRRVEHDTGLRLLRAQRRRDQEAPSALWVRRVTGVSDA